MGVVDVVIGIETSGDEGGRIEIDDAGRRDVAADAFEGFLVTYGKCYAHFFVMHGHIGR